MWLDASKASRRASFFPGALHLAAGGQHEAVQQVEADGGKRIQLEEPETMGAGVGARAQRTDCGPKSTIGRRMGIKKTVNVTWNGVVSALKSVVSELKSVVSR